MAATKRSTGTIRQTVWIEASPRAVYRALATSRGHAAFTGAPARISSKVGGSYSAWEDYIHGTNLELVPDQKIVQTWVASEEKWPAGHESKVAFVLTPWKGGTRLTFTHTGVPSPLLRQLSQGWKDAYWSPLKAYLE